MGYMGLSHFQESDSASDLAYVMGNAMAKVLRKGLEEAGNCYNTDGVVNVAMIFRDVIVPNVDSYCYNDKLQKIAKETHKRLRERIESDNPNAWNDKANRKMHMDAFKKMLKSLEKFIGEAV